MSRSRRKPIIKDRPRNYKKSTRYWRKIRRIWKIEVDLGKEVTQAKELENDYNYCDYKFINCEEKHTRK